DLRPSGKEAVPLAFCPYAQCFQIPTVAAVVLVGEVSPKFGCFRGIQMADSDSSFSTDLCVRVFDQYLEIGGKVHFQLPRSSQGNNSDICMWILQCSGNMALTFFGDFAQ